jgi:Flp pilus assembly protein TadD
METIDENEVVELLVEDTPSPRFGKAAELLERAVAAGTRDDSVLSLLALAYKRQGKPAEAHAALRKIDFPDAEVLLQMALLSLQLNQVAQAEEELTRAREMDPSCYEICYNLLLTRLTLGRIAPAAELVETAIALATQRGIASERRFLIVLHGLLRNAEVNGDPRFDPILADLTTDDEKRLLTIVRDIGHLDASVSLLKMLSIARPSSAAIREAYLEVVLVKAKELMDRCAWTETELLLRLLAKDSVGPRGHRAALLNMLGCCACLTHDFNGALRHLGEAVKLAPGEPRLHQNLAMVHELQGDLSKADPHWNRFFDLLDDRIPGPGDIRDYATSLAFHGLRRLADRYREKEKWTQALDYLQRALALRPDDSEVLDQLFTVYNQAKKPDEARKTLNRLRELRPQEPQLELYEAELTDLKSLNDIERVLNEVDRVVQRYPGDARVEDRVLNMLANILPLMSNFSDQFTGQMSKVLDQVRNLPDYQVNWSAVREVMRDLLKEFQKLRRVTAKCLPLVKNDEQRRVVRDLADHVDKKIETCRSMKG